MSNVSGKETALAMVIALAIIAVVVCASVLVTKSQIRTVQDIQAQLDAVERKLDAIEELAESLRLYD